MSEQKKNHDSISQQSIVSKDINQLELFSLEQNQIKPNKKKLFDKFDVTNINVDNVKFANDKNNQQLQTKIEQMKKLTEQHKFKMKADDNSNNKQSYSSIQTANSNNIQQYIPTAKFESIQQLDELFNKYKNQLNITRQQSNYSLNYSNNSLNIQTQSQQNNTYDRVILEYKSNLEQNNSQSPTESSTISQNQIQINEEVCKNDIQKICYHNPIKIEKQIPIDNNVEKVQNFVIKDLTTLSNQTLTDRHSEIQQNQNNPPQNLNILKEIENTHNFDNNCIQQKQQQFNQLHHYYNFQKPNNYLYKENNYNTPNHKLSDYQEQAYHERKNSLSRKKSNKIEGKVHETPFQQQKNDLKTSPFQIQNKQQQFDQDNISQQLITNRSNNFSEQISANSIFNQTTVSPSLQIQHDNISLSERNKKLSISNQSVLSKFANACNNCEQVQYKMIQLQNEQSQIRDSLKPLLLNFEMIIKHSSKQLMDFPKYETNEAIIKKINELMENLKDFNEKFLIKEKTKQNNDNQPPKLLEKILLSQNDSEEISLMEKKQLKQFFLNYLAICNEKNKQEQQVQQMFKGFETIADNISKTKEQVVVANKLRHNNHNSSFNLLIGNQQQ